MDIRNKKNCKELIEKLHPDLIIHTAALVNTDYCEKNKTETYKINFLGTQNLLEPAIKIKSKFIYFSSNGVFDGKHPPYSETDPVNPINYYGKTKAEGEEIVKKYMIHSMIIRLSNMYGWNDPLERENPATWLLKRFKDNQKTYMVSDVYNNHLWVGQAAKAVWKSINKQLYGNIIHIGGKDTLSRYEFAIELIKIFYFNKNLVIPVKSKFFKGLAPRPRNTCLSTQKMENLLKINPITVKAGLLKMKKAMK